MSREKTFIPERNFKILLDTREQFYSFDLQKYLIATRQFARTSNETFERLQESQASLFVHYSLCYTAQSVLNNYRERKIYSAVYNTICNTLKNGNEIQTNGAKGERINDKRFFVVST